MRNDLEANTSNYPFGRLKERHDNLVAEIRELRAVVDPLTELLKLKTRVDIVHHSECFWVSVTGLGEHDSSLAAALAALRDAAKPPEPKWTVECPGIIGLDEEFAVEKVAVSCADAQSRFYPEQGVKVLRDGKLFCVFVGGVRCNPEAKGASE